eukprot:Hpha_TRINITY_DN3680_c0_g1::TRINITY_DN3680_c0_g1_i1::g.873::m.873
MADELRWSAAIQQSHVDVYFSLFSDVNECSPLDVQSDTDRGFVVSAPERPKADECLASDECSESDECSDSDECSESDECSGIDECSQADEEAAVLSQVVRAAGSVLQQVAETEGDCECDELYDSMGEWDGLDLPEFIQRWVQYSEVSDTEVILAMIYIDRIALKTGTRICHKSVHRLLLGSLLLATKWREEDTFRMSWYAKVGGTSREDLSQLEIRVAQDLDFCFAVDADELRSYTDILEAHPCSNAE